MLIRLVSLENGRCSSLATVLILIPRKVRVVEGPSILAGLTGSPSLVSVRTANYKVSLQVPWLVDQKMKSSK